MTTVTNYASLTQALNDWFVRVDLGTKVDNFIQLAENMIYNDIFARNVGCGTEEMEATFTGSTDPVLGTLPVPTGYLGLKFALIETGGNSFELTRRNAEFIYMQYPNRQPSSTPAYIARNGQVFVFGPCPDASYAITGIYWQRTAPLSAANPTTWMTAGIPMVLLAACCIGAATLLKDTANFQFWSAAYQSQLESYLLADRSEDVSGSSFAMTPG
jgi:hypothetical protein